MERKAPFCHSSVKVDIYNGHSFPADFWGLGQMSTQKMLLKAACGFLSGFNLLMCISRLTCSLNFKTLHCTQQVTIIHHSMLFPSFHRPGASAVYSHLLLVYEDRWAESTTLPAMGLQSHLTGGGAEVGIEYFYSRQYHLLTASHKQDPLRSVNI